MRASLHNANRTVMLPSATPALDLLQSISLVARHRGPAELGPTEHGMLRDTVSDMRALSAGDVLGRANRPATESAILLQGALARVVNAQDGRRQIVALHVPGDFVDLHSLLLQHLDHDIVALKASTVAMTPHAELSRLLRAQPTLANKLWYLTLTDAAVHRQWMFRVAATTAIERVANVLCEIDLRLMAIGQSDGHRFALHLTQAEMGEICGVTSIHVNRVLRELREHGLCTWQASQVDIHDLGRLCAVGGFCPDYLYYDAPLLDAFQQLAGEPRG